MRFSTRLIAFPLNHPKLILITVLVITVLLSIPLLRVTIDNSPENLFSDQELVSLVNQQDIDTFSLGNMVIVGVINRVHEQGVFNPKTLDNVLALSQFAATMATAEHSEVDIKVSAIVTPDKVESIQHDGLGQVRFDWLMQEVPRTAENAQSIRDLALANPLLKDALVSGDGRALTLYFPVSGPHAGHTFNKELRQKIKTLDRGEDRFYITGPPVLTDTIERTMISYLLTGALLSSLVLFGLMLLHFKKAQLTLPPLSVAIITVIAAMTLLIATGHSLHVINVSIFILIIPIAMVSSIRLVAESIAVYPETNNHRQALEQALTAIFIPSSYTTLTLTAAFASLALFPVSSVKLFGVVTAVSISLVWLLTFTFVPAFLMLMKEEVLHGQGDSSNKDRYNSVLNRLLQSTRQLATVHYWKCIGVYITILILGVLCFMLSEKHNNPLQLLKKNNTTRIADKVLNAKFGGIHETLLVLSGPESDLGAEEAADWLIGQLSSKLSNQQMIYESIEAEIRLGQQTANSGSELAETLATSWAKKLNELPIEESLAHDIWSKAVDTLEQLRHQQQLFNRPNVLAYIDDMQGYLAQQQEVGAVHSVLGIVKKIHQELFEGDPAHFTIPETANGVSQTLLAYKNSHRPETLNSFITSDYNQTTIRIRLNSGDSKHMERLDAHVDAYLKNNRPPIALEYRWVGPSYINLIVQDRIIGSMLKSFAVSLAMAVLVMSLLFRSPSWGLLAMLPLTGTTGIIFMLTGMTGWNYNLVTTPLTFLSLGLAVDFAINFLQPSRMAMVGCGTWSETLTELFGRPAQAITLSTLIIASSCIPLLIIPLPLLQIAAVIMLLTVLTAGCTTICTLPAALTILQPGIFKREIALFNDTAEAGIDQTAQNSDENSVLSADQQTLKKAPKTKAEEELT